MIAALNQVEMTKILVVDDYTDTAESMALWLKLIGHHVEVARDGYRAIELARRKRPDYVLLDLGLPGLDGYEVARRLRQELAGPLVILAITGHGREVDRRRALAAGCDDLLLKPIDLNALHTRLSALHAEPARPPDDVRPRVSKVDGSAPKWMVSRQVEIINPQGLHMRAAERFVSLARQFQAEVRVGHAGRRVSGRSLLDLLTLGAVCGTRLELEAEGPDAAAALDALGGLARRGFDEHGQ